MTMAQPPSTSLAEPTSDSVSRFLDEPFKTWPTTILFGALLMVIGGVAIFLGLRYMEALRFNHRNCCKVPLTLEGLRANQTAHGRNNEIPSSHQGATSADTGLWDDHDSDIRRRSELGDVHRGTVAIGEVREGRIAQRRASSSRKA